ncbi:MAG: hypothetical protein N2439_11765 [Anaerolineae bacterium]|nr:hypothetical protein [Anaerolineae bacterium]
MRQYVGRLWRGWTEIAGYFGDFQARLLLTLFYFTVLVPFALITRRLVDPLRRRRPPTDSNWIPRPAHDESLSASRQQF